MDASVHVLTLAAAALVTAGLAGYALVERDEPGARQFAGMMAAATVWSGCYAVALLQTGDARILWEYVQWFGIATAPVFLFLFAAAYTGRDRLATRRVAVALFVVPAVTVALVWTNRYHHLVWVDHDVVRVEGITLLSQQFGAWYWMNLLFSYGLAAAASLMLLWLVVASEYLYADQALSLVVGVVAPVVANALSVFGAVPLTGIDLTPYAFALTGLAFGNALFRYRLFELLPATRQLGQQAALVGLDDGVVILDTDRRVLYMNPAAGEVLGREPSAALGERVWEFVDADDLDFGATDRFAEVTFDGRTYEVETAPIRNRRDQRVGYTVLLYDVTARKRRERELRAQRDRLQRLERINTVVREVNQALVGATTVADVERSVTETLATSGPYDAAWLSTVASDRVAVGMTADDDAPRTPDASEDLPAALDAPASVSEAASADVPRADGGDWATVALVHGRTVYGALALHTDREEGFGERERTVLNELGETLGRALNAAERTRLLVSDTRVELDFQSTDGGALLVALSDGTGAEWTLDGLVPAEENALVLYLGTDADAESGVDLASAHPGVSEVRRVGDDGTTLEVTAESGTLAHPLVEYGANVRDATATDGRCRVTAEVSPDTNVRPVVERVTDSFPETDLLARREVEPADETALPADPDITDRQREALEAAYRAGYFEWPRESTAEEVAESLDIAAPTLHGHLRKAENRLVDLFFEE